MATTNKDFNSFLTIDRYTWFYNRANSMVISMEYAKVLALRHVYNDFSHRFGDKEGGLGVSKLSLESTRSLA